MSQLLQIQSRWSTGLWVASVAAAFFLGLLPSATAQEVLVTDQLRQWSAPAGTDGFTARRDNQQAGTLVLTSNRGVVPEAFDARCVITVVDDRQARVFTYRHQFEYSRCVDATADGAGGLFVRGAVVEDFEDDGQGFTVRIDADGQVLWSVDDDRLVQAEASPDGPGEFYGDYGRPLPGLTYDEGSNRLVGRVLGQQELPDQTPNYEQLFVLDASSGELRSSGRRFGPDLRDPIADVVARDGEFLVHTTHGEEETPYFYSFDGQRQVRRLQPGEQSWEDQKVVGPLAYWPSAGTLILSEEPSMVGSASPTQARVTAVEGLDDVAWQQDLEGTVDIDGESTDIGRPERVWAGQQWVVVRFRDDDNERYLQVLDAATGELLSTVSWYDLMTIDPIDLVRGESGDLQLLAVDRTVNELALFALTLGQRSSDEGGDEQPSPDEQGCAATGVPKGPTAPLGALILVALIAWRRRRP